MKKQLAPSHKLTRKTWILLVSLAIVVLLLGLATWRVWAFASHPLYPSLADLSRQPTRAQPVAINTTQPGATGQPGQTNFTFTNASSAEFFRASVFTNY